MSIMTTDNVRLALQTRMQTDIQNLLNRTKPIPGMHAEVEGYKKKYISARHRPVGPCSTYNCHGLTFAARRTNIDSPSDVRRILQEDDYVRIEKKDVSPGDVAIYIRDGDIEHSGLVVEITDLGPLILSKWGGCQEVIHNIGNCPYNPNEIHFYRVAK